MNLLSCLLGGSVPTLSALELKEKLQDGKRLFLLDVRQPGEFCSGHIASEK
jgi:rhodanese-related sulfurtransferase